MTQSVTLFASRQQFRLLVAVRTACKTHLYFTLGSYSDSIASAWTGLVLGRLRYWGAACILRLAESPAHLGERDESRQRK